MFRVCQIIHSILTKEAPRVPENALKTAPQALGPGIARRVPRVPDHSQYLDEKAEEKKVVESVDAWTMDCTYFFGFEVTSLL